MKKTTFAGAAVLLFLFPFVEVAVAQQAKRAIVECQPVYGHYGRSYKWGWYGAPREVRTAVEAREIIEQILLQEKGIRVVRMREMMNFYVAELMNDRGMIVDLILIDKRTGRIRSMF